MWVNDSRRNLAGVFIGQMLSIAGFSFFMPLLPLFIRTLGPYGTTEAVQWSGAINAISSLVMAVGQPFWGAMSDRWGRKPMVIRSMVGSGVTAAMMGLVVSPEQLLGLYILQGMVTGTMAATTALVAASVPRQRLGFGLGMLQVAVFLGATGGPLGGGLIADHFGFRTAFFAAGALLCLGAVVVATQVRESFVRPSASAQGRGMWAEGRSLLAITSFPLLVGVIFLIQFGNTVMQPVLSLFIAGLSDGENVATSVGIVMGATGAVSAVSAFVIGRLGDRVGHRPILLICLVGTTLAYLPQALAQEVWQLLLLRMVLGAFLGGMMPSANALVANVVPRERRGAAFGITAASSALSHAAGPAFGAGVATFLGLRPVFVATGVIFALAFLWAALTVRKPAPTPARLAEVAQPVQPVPPA